MSGHEIEWTRPDGLPVRRRRRRRPLVIVLLVLLVLAGLFVAADRLAAAYAEDRIATQLQKQGFATKPDVTIDGFPFLTQVADRRFAHAHLTARDLTEGPLTIDRIVADVRDVRTSADFRSGTIGAADGTATIAFGDLAKAGGQPGLALRADGPDKVRADVDFGIGSGTMVWQVAKVGRDKIRVHPLSAEGFSLADLGQDLDFTVPVSGLPMGLAFQSLTVGADGVHLHVTGAHIPFHG